MGYAIDRMLLYGWKVDEDEDGLGTVPLPWGEDNEGGRPTLAEWWAVNSTVPVPAIPVDGDLLDVWQWQKHHVPVTHHSYGVHEWWSGVFLGLRGDRYRIGDSGSSPFIVDSLPDMSDDPLVCASDVTFKTAGVPVSNPAWFIIAGFG